MAKIPGYISKLLVLDPTVSPAVTPPSSYSQDSTGTQVLYHTGGYTEVKGMGDCTFSAPQSSYDTTTHDTGQWKTSQQGRKEASIDTKFMYDAADPGQAIILLAWEKARAIMLHFVMNTTDTTTKFYEGLGYIEKFDLSSPADGICMMDVSFKFSSAVSIITPQPAT